MSQQVKVSGLEDLVATLREHGHDVRAGLEMVGRSGAEVLRAEMSKRAPVRTGYLREHIGIGDAKIDEAKGQITIPVGPNNKAFYGLFQEFGTRHHPAQPFMRPAADESQAQVLAAAKAAAKKLIEGIA